MTIPVTVQHGGVEITTNTASEADLRAELTRDDKATEPTTSEPAKPEAPAATPAPRARDEQGRFVTTSEQTPVAEAPGEPPPTPDPETPQRRRDDTTPRHNPILRMNQALAQKAEAERRAAALEAELARYRQSTPRPTLSHDPLAAPVRAEMGATNGHAAEPQFEQFAGEPDPYTAYVQAWARWDNRRQIAETIAAYEQAQTQKARQAQFEARLADGRKGIPDFDQRLTEADTLGLQVSAVMREAIAESPHAADLVYYLATHPEECTQLALETETTPPAAASVMRRLLESHLAPRAAASNGAGTAVRAPVSTAKPPVTPVGSSPVVSDDPPGDTASAAEHARYWNRRLKVPGTK